MRGFGRDQGMRSHRDRFVRHRCRLPRPRGGGRRLDQHQVRARGRPGWAEINETEMKQQCRRADITTKQSGPMSTAGRRRSRAPAHGVDRCCRDIARSTSGHPHLRLGQWLFLVSAPPPARVSRSQHLGQPNEAESDAALQSLVALAGNPLACRLALSDLVARCLLARGIAAGPGRSVAAALTGCGRGHAGAQRGGLRRPLAALADRPGLSRSGRRDPGRRQQRGSHPCDRRSYDDAAGPPARGDRRAPSAGRLVGQAVGGVRRAPTRLRADAGRAVCPAH